MTSSLNKKVNKVEGGVFNKVMLTSVIQVLHYLRLGGFCHEMREERREDREENKTGDGVHDGLVDRGSAGSPVVLFSCLKFLALLFSVVGPERIQGSQIP